ncbi:hypothetical protein OUZ56_004569 [Daphnia magna]|uniref:Uncharacterized protein n=1 Tax=Daphnia magna TaxID=35525 RepID=A0ABQ9YQ61_9CRUS|nr:hypothetical protein OUZ56_004569 [Daphnia magna]
MNITNFPNFYRVLGVESNASLADMKQRYHQLCLKYHPDKNQGANNEDFIKVQLAFQVLSDPNLKQHYDVQHVAHTNKCVAIHDQMSISELNFDGSVYETNCRCGGSFVLFKEATELSLAEIYVTCDTCSLCISVAL